MFANIEKVPDRFNLAVKNSVLLSVLTSWPGAITIAMMIGCVDALTTCIILEHDGQEQNIILSHFVGPNFPLIILAVRILAVVTVFMVIMATKHWLGDKKKSVEKTEAEWCEKYCTGLGVAAMLLFWIAVTTNNIYQIAIGIL